ncbi:DDB1- and CUL4-associated factor 11-like isoform X3 [Tachypleus tridentatus]|uniref:DDB1- and CUL4-associated factor 11-like isoform X3 n=1 Tax=Tachypleus tridentatus TaxID=6853 RepID=UPI003FCF85A2
MGLNIAKMSRMGENEARDRDSDSRSDHEIATVLQCLIRRYLDRRRSGPVRIFGSRSGQSEGDTGDTCAANTSHHEPNPDTSCIGDSDIKQSILLQSGDFGNLASGQSNKVPSFPSLVRRREIGVKHHEHFSIGDCCQFSLRLLPNRMKIVERFHSKGFIGTFTRNGDFFISAAQDCMIRIYDTSRECFKLVKVVAARDVGWSVLDIAVSPNGQHFIYSSWSEYIHICDLDRRQDNHTALFLWPEDQHFCVFSLRFSHDGKEILGGANDECIYIYDRELNKRSLKVRSHEDDVNTVDFADSTSQIIFSGGDDGLCKVWDRRALNEEFPKPVGVLAGHLDGITYIDPKGDGRHLITNSKDQTIKLWDMRAFSSSEAVKAARSFVSSHHWDYRWQNFPRKLAAHRKKLRGDTSLMTYREHCVFKTLIRCHFSPEFTTGQRFIYTGCESGNVIIYDVLTGKIVKILSAHRGCVRDVSWHPYRQELVSISWDGTLRCWTYSGKHALDSGDGQFERTGRLGLRKSQRIAQSRMKPQIS